MALAARKQQVEVDDGAVTFEAARSQFSALQAEREAKDLAVENLRLLVSWNAAGEAERASDRLAWIRGRIAQAWPNAKPKEHRVNSMLRDAEDAVADFMPKFTAAAEEFEQSRRRRTAALAQGLQPRQRVAVVAMADALSALSKALAEEKAVHDELVRTAPHASSAYLPNCRMEIIIGGFDDFASLASSWRRRMRKLRILA